MVDFTKPATVVITGAGRGYGRALCLSFVRHLQSDSILILLGRSMEPLESTKSLASEVNDSVAIYVYENFDCNAFGADSLTSFLEDLTPKLSSSSTNSLLIVHNAGTVGDPSQKSLEYDLASVSEYMVVNFASMVAVNSVLLKTLGSFCEQKAVVNITSLMAIQPGKSLGLYCSGKAARDMFFRVLAAENPTLRVLSYAPGPMDTSMLKTIAEKSHDQEIKTAFQGITFVKMEDTAERLITLLKANKFESGAHIDVFDPLPE